MTLSSARPASLRPTRRTENVRVQGRSARVVEAILQAVAEELGRVGYADLRIEEVATLSGVNKTTIYRRWPQKSELVIAAVERLTPVPEIYDTGTLRGDLLALLHDMRARITETPVGRGIVRMVQAERAHPEVSGMLRRIRIKHSAARCALFERAVAKGEIPAGSDCALLSELAVVPLISRLVHFGQDADDDFLRVQADMIVAGARAGAAVV
ncbi:MAG: tetR [Myxococcaceae bacterium]|nr:tetR [Myxococcaceae bacterium]